MYASYWMHGRGCFCLYLLKMLRTAALSAYAEHFQSQLIVPGACRFLWGTLAPMYSPPMLS